MSTLPLQRPVAPALADLAAGSLVREGLLVAGGVGLLALSAQIAVPLPFTPVPLTGQTFAVLLIGAGYGLRRALGTMLVYLAVGLAGFPVFSPDPATGHARTALQILHAPSAGYIVGMLLAMGVLGWLTGRSWDRRWRTSVAQMALASVAIYAVGLAWLAVAADLTLQQTLVKGLLPFLIGDVLKLLLAAGAAPILWRWVGSRGDS
ncbi:MAG: biotin transporter BioY [Dermatophilaceae bacterium]|nr:biotin transporter BioY [Dermatophilaceae bacterium]MBU9943014.1 biotin transporter BioY [Dermatophilaceae bacterium]